MNSSEILTKFYKKNSSPEEKIEVLTEMVFTLYLEVEALRLTAAAAHPELYKENYFKASYQKFNTLLDKFFGKENPRQAILLQKLETSPEELALKLKKIRDVEEWT